MAIVMKMEKKYIQRRRVAFVIALALAGVLAWAVWQVSGHLWWVGGEEGYCWGDMITCYFGEGK